jgi:hypothetical protein
MVGRMFSALSSTSSAFQAQDRDARRWYAQKVIENGWSRFEHSLPAPDSELVRDAIKDR